MIVLLYNFVILLQAVYLLGNGYAAVKFYRLPDRMGKFLAASFLANGAQALFGLFTLGFGPRPQIVWWTVAALILGQLIRVSGTAVLALFLLGLINGAGNYAAKEEAK